MGQAFADQQRHVICQSSTNCLVEIVASQEVADQLVAIVAEALGVDRLCPANQIVRGIKMQGTRWQLVGGISDHHGASNEISQTLAAFGDQR